MPAPEDAFARRIDRLVLLAGSVRATDLTRGTGRSVLDLPVTPTRTLLGLWCEQAVEAAAWSGHGRLAVDVVLDPSTDAPRVPATDPRIHLHIRRDEASFRGTGGALRDIAWSMNGFGRLLVANAGQILTTGISAIAQRLASEPADVSIVAHEDGTPSGVMLVSTKTLESVKSVGFVDFKEQVLPSLGEAFDIRAVKFEHATGRPVRTRESYIEAMRAHYGAMGGSGPFDPFAERWAPTFGVAERGADVDPSARLHDSVVIRGGRVGAGAVVVRSIVGPEGVVGRGEIVVDQVVSAEAARGLGRSA